MKFRSPKYEEASVSIPEETAQLRRSFNGTVCSKKGDEYEINNNIIDFLDSEPLNMSLAQSSNQWKLTASLYENVWRNRSLSIFSGEAFPIEKEKRFLTEWMNPRPEHKYLDVGCSTALYARKLKQAQPDCDVVALDFSKRMLQEARPKAEADQTDLYLLRADARFMPFYGATFNGLMMGGTLNELTDPLKVLYECRRVLKMGGVFFMMHLVKADAWYARLLQSSTEYGGLKFWDMAESNQLFERAGFSLADQYRQGIVCFTKLKAA